MFYKVSEWAKAGTSKYKFRNSQLSESQGTCENADSRAIPGLLNRGDYTGNRLSWEFGCLLMLAPLPSKAHGWG